jgi:hypothetical protein
MPLDYEIKEDEFKLKGKIPDKIMYLIIGILIVSLGLNAEEVLTASSVFF